MFTVQSHKKEVTLQTFYLKYVYAKFQQSILYDSSKSPVSLLPTDGHFELYIEYSIVKNKPQLSLLTVVSRLKDCP